MAKQVQFRRGSTFENDAFTGAVGEVTVDTTTKGVRVHDGSTAGGTPSVTPADISGFAPKASPTFTGTVAGVTKAMVGLGSADDTSDANKPVSIAAQAELDAKAPLNSPTFTGVVAGVTKAHVGLGNADNTSDANKPISTAAQTAINLKAPINDPTFTGAVSGVTKAHVGLPLVDNTSDANKPISAAAQAVLDVKADLVGGTVPVSQLPDAVLGATQYQGLWNATTNTPTIPAAASGNTGHYYVVSVAGTTNVDGITDWEISDWIISNGTSWDKLDNSATVVSVAGKTGAVSLVKADVGLTLADNTADTGKPVSVAQQAALDDKAPINGPTFTGTVAGVTKAHVGLGDANNTSDANKPVSTAAQTALDLKSPINNPTFTGTVAGVTKAMVGLGNADNTSDANKPVSVDQQTALDLNASNIALQALTDAELLARSGASLEVFDSTGASSLTVVTGPGNGITVSFGALTLRQPSGIGTISALGATEVAPGMALVIDISGSSPFTASVESAGTTLYDAALAGTKAILLQQSTNRLIGIMAASATRALDAAGISNINNTSDADKPISTAALAALNGLSWVFLDNTSSTAITTAERSGNGINVGWSTLKFRTSLGEVSVAARTAAVLDPDRALYIDPAEGPVGDYTVVETDASAVLSGLEATGARIILLQTDTGRAGGRLESAFTRKLGDNVAQAISDDAYLATMQPAGIAATEQWLATPSWNRQLAFSEVNAGGNYYQYQPEREEGRIAVTNTNTTIDLEYLQSGASVTIWAKGGGAKVFLPVNYIGGSGNRAVMSANDVVKITQLGDYDAPAFLLETLSGTPTWSVVARPAMDQTIATAGQSNWAIAFGAAGLGGFTDRLLGRYATVYPSTYFVDGATGGTSIIGASGWWNGGVPGAALVTYIAALDAAVAAGQPAAAVTLWRQGEQDMTNLDNGTLTITGYKAAVQAVFEYIRAYDGGTYSGMTFIASGPQAQDDTTEFGGAMAARVAYIELAEDFAYVHEDASWYDVPRPYGPAPQGVHPFNPGYWAMGFRTATAYLRSLGGGDATRDIGPYINGSTLAVGGLSVALDIRCETDTVVLPDARRGMGSDLGPYPMEFCAIIGDPRTATAIPLTGGTTVRVSDTQVTLTLTADVDLTGARIYTFNGKSPYARRKHFFRNDNKHGPMLGYSMRDQRTAVLA